MPVLTREQDATPDRPRAPVLAKPRTQDLASKGVRTSRARRPRTPARLRLAGLRGRRYASPPIVTDAPRITRTQQSDAVVETSLDLHYVRHPVAYGLHSDDTPSLQIYPSGTFYCFGCRRGGSIYDFASALWLSGQSPNAPLRGRPFIEVRQRLLAMFLGDDAAA
jgi:hypothetical protein